MKQNEAIDIFLPINKKRKYLKESFRPGEKAMIQSSIAPYISVLLKCICSALIKKKKKNVSEREINGLLESV